MGNTNERVCAIYTRVSTEEQAKKGYSLSEQKKDLLTIANIMILKYISIMKMMEYLLKQEIIDLHLNK